MRDYCSSLDVTYLETSLERGQPLTRVKHHCYLCARLKRGALSGLLAAEGIRTVAFGHHANDVAETLLMNIAEHAKLGSFCPTVTAPGKDLRIIRPLVYLDESLLRRLHRSLGLPLLDYACPFAADNIRTDYKELTAEMERRLGKQGLAVRIVHSLENIDATNMWSAVVHREKAAR